MRYLQFIDVGFGISVKLVIRLFVTVNCLTNDKAERNDMRLRYWINEEIRLKVFSKFVLLILLT